MKTERARDVGIVLTFVFAVAMFWLIAGGPPWLHVIAWPVLAGALVCMVLVLP